MLISCFLLLDPVPNTTAETTPVSRPLAFTVTTGTSSTPVSTAPVPASSNLLLDSLKKMQSSQAAPVPAGEERGQWNRTVAE